MRLIDADKLPLDIEREDVEDAPTVDAVEVVRCKDCKYGDTYEMGVPLDGSVRCNLHDDGYEIHDTLWFCADGERKTE